MNAIQRWYFYDGEHKHDPTQWMPVDQLWCKAKDVAELERVIAEQSAKNKKITDTLRDRISFLERTGMDIQADISKERADHVRLRDAHEGLTKRYDLLMQRRKPPARDPMCCNDYPECHHGR